MNTLPTSQIEPDRPYALVDACQFIPSHQGGHVTPETLRNWHRAGLFRGRSRTIGRLTYRFIYGREILALIGEETGPASDQDQRPAARKPAARTSKRDLEILRTNGFEV